MDTRAVLMIALARRGRVQVAHGAATGVDAASVSTGASADPEPEPDVDRDAAGVSR